ncbi:alanine racemase [Noviherbaspirillum sp. CPCC 100848]|uniref:Alanine racemase n=1 Tax=Noviherbaspirillum album TaxID=3080276 RepID=A0ABU6J7F1_9BURK|nr:alanine racemase [Noviherbaspirillum sp. CPCC 100848]MEC4719582.1 alanine racemase [Noviherbaspirillum sp. CPCC 100848]
MKQEAFSVSTVPTPSVILDRQKLIANCRRMAARAAGAGVKLRPHLKTAKSAEVAALATSGQFGGITVSTLAELRYFFEHGIRDMTYAVGITPGKMPVIEGFIEQGAVIRIVLDSAGMVDELAARESGFKGRVPVLIEIDCGGHRAGVAAEGVELLDIARRIAGVPGLVLDGVLTHAGHSYHAADAGAREAIAVAERDAAVLAAGRLREAGHACPTVSIGSTPTALTGIALDGVTEIRPGVYVFFDLAQAALGVCSPDDIAVSVVATVIGQHRAAGHLLIDAGALALSKDTSAGEFRQHVGYGLVCDLEGRLLDGMHVADAHQEHGFVRCSAGTIDFDRFPVGSRLRILPNHACMTVAPYPEYQVFESMDRPLVQWSKTTGW